MPYISLSSNSKISDKTIDKFNAYHYRPVSTAYRTQIVTANKHIKDNSYYTWVTLLEFESLNDIVYKTDAMGNRAGVTGQWSLHELNHSEYNKTQEFKILEKRLKVYEKTIHIKPKETTRFNFDFTDNLQLMGDVLRGKAVIFATKQMVNKIKRTFPRYDFKILREKYFYRYSYLLVRKKIPYSAQITTIFERMIETIGGRIGNASRVQIPYIQRKSYEMINLDEF
ncbi:unnamed protein product [Oppiella nova]|uniref:Uncharacterized protein n=1 Tax=Oppiella nova TaxID=334625 RepID=A0A7R9QNG2_9ACAR|nr:unnamed protein product [Oppiella nova]CAG2169098.1 unnamed protein product [Oppiella nova]